jgi:translation initiation factor 3 subunit J
VQRKKKKKLAEIIAEKEAAKAAELDQRAATEAAKKQMNTPEAKLAERMRLQKLEENANLQMAKDMFGELLDIFSELAFFNLCYDASA